MNYALLFLLISANVYSQENCRNIAITDKIIGSMTDMVASEKTDCKAYGKLWKEEGDEVYKFIKCDKDLKNKFKELESCYLPMKLLNDIEASIDKIPYEKICSIYRPQLEANYKKCRKL